MSNDYDNTNSGALFKNKNKKGPKSPEYTGSIDVEGEEYWISAWLKKSKAGKPFMSLSLTKKDAPAESNKDFDESDIPF
jgi:uncharacterized protein (DUF736 family)